MSNIFKIARLLVALAIVLISGTSCGWADSRAMYLPVDETPLLAMGHDGVGKRIAIEIADTADERAKGLMFRPALSSDHGMLFVFPYTREVSFWMENTPQPLDLVFIKDDGHVAAVMYGKPYSRSIIDPKVPVRYVLELAAGVAAKSGIRGGTLMVHPVMGNVRAVGMN
jgi:uncharacterized membrane protein (UPF0127 family)